jgi:hypothetical protein
LRPSTRRSSCDTQFATASAVRAARCARCNSRSAARRQRVCNTGVSSRSRFTLLTAHGRSFARARRYRRRTARYHAADAHFQGQRDWCGSAVAIRIPNPAMPGPRTTLCTGSWRVLYFHGVRNPYRVFLRGVKAFLRALLRVSGCRERIFGRFNYCRAAFHSPAHRLISC